MDLESFSNSIQFITQPLTVSLKMKGALVFLIFAASFQCYLAIPTIVRADGNSVGTYALFNRLLGGEAVENPDCAHPDFGPHITQVVDPELNVPVFAFHAHVTPDNDRCQTFDRSRVEIKTYAPSPDYLKAFEGDTVRYTWDMKLDAEFKVTNPFTHLHQLKYVGGNDGMPVISVTAFHYTTGRHILEVRYAEDSTASSMKVEDLDKFLGKWLHFEEEAYHRSNGTYSLRITELQTGLELLSVEDTSINMWRAGGTEFDRPKWGIYRSLNAADALRDEIVYFNNFCLAKHPDTCS